MTKLKQYTLELFNKNRKTVDPNFVKRMQYVAHLQAKVNDIWKACNVFMLQSGGKSFPCKLSKNGRNFEMHRVNGTNYKNMLC